MSLWWLHHVWTTMVHDKLTWFSILNMENGKLVVEHMVGISFYEVRIRYKVTDFLCLFMLWFTNVIYASHFQLSAMNNIYDYRKALNRVLFLLISWLLTNYYIFKSSRELNPPLHFHDFRFVIVAFLWSLAVAHNHIFFTSLGFFQFLIVYDFSNSNDLTIWSREKKMWNMYTERKYKPK